MECLESDWKLFRKKIGVWQDNYIEKLTKEYIQLLMGDSSASDKFWELESRIRKDKKHPGVIIEMKRSAMVFNIVSLINYEVIKLEDLEEFSKNLQETVEFLVERFK